MGYTGRIQRVIDCSNLESPGVFSEKPPRTLAQCGRVGKAEKPEGL